MKVEDVTFELNSISLSGKRWRSGEGTPVIALHGWLDNCASFDLLAPKLPGLDIVALDMAGHGRSQYRKGLGAYNIWEDIAEIIAVTEQLNWPKFALLGHSRGAMISTLIAGTFPEKVTHVGLIESVLPYTLDDREAPKQLASAVDNILRLSKRERHYYESFDKAVEARANGIIALGIEDSRILANRGVMHDGQGHYWGSDPLLMAPSEVKLTHDQIMAFVENIKVQCALVIAEQGMLVENDMVSEWLAKASHITAKHIAGTHHLHMSEQYEEVAKFLANYYES